MTADAAPKSIPHAEQIKLWTRAAGAARSATSTCSRTSSRAQPVSLAELAHNVGRQKTPGSPRGLADLPIEERNKAENLLLLCGDHHRVIDAKVAARRLHRRAAARAEAAARGQDPLPDRARRGRRDRRRAHDRQASAAPPSSCPRRWSAAPSHGANRYPRYHLTFRGGDIELDLRAAPRRRQARRTGARAAGGSTPSSRASATASAQDAIRHLSVFAAGRIPLLVYLGSKLDDKVPTDLYQKQRDGEEGWHWDDGAPVASLRGGRQRARAPPTTSRCWCRSAAPSTSTASRTTHHARDDDLHDPARVGAAATPDIFRSRSVGRRVRGHVPHLPRRDRARPPRPRRDRRLPGRPARRAPSRSAARAMADVHPPLRIYDRNGDGGYSLRSGDRLMELGSTTSSTSSRTPST